MSTIDPKTLTAQQIKQALSLHCQLMGSHAYYYAVEVERWQKDPDCLVVFSDTDSHGAERLRAYTRTSHEKD